MALQFALLDGRRHDRLGFACGIAVLDEYLRRLASQHQRDGIATTHVLTDDTQPARILGYCSLAAAQLRLDDLQPGDRKRLPAYPVPCVRLARLAVTRGVQGKGIGRLLLGHALNCALAMRANIGVRLLVVDAKDARAASFYAGFGFRSTAEAGNTLYLPLGRP